MEPPEFVRVTACVWLVPTVTPTKLTFEGLTASVPLPANAVELKVKIAANERSETNLNGILVHFGPRFFTARPRKAALELPGWGIEAAASC